MNQPHFLLRDEKSWLKIIFMRILFEKVYFIRIASKNVNLSSKYILTIIIMQLLLVGPSFHHQFVDILNVRIKWSLHASITFILFLCLHFFFFSFYRKQIYVQNFYLWRTEFILCTICWNYNLVCWISFPFSRFWIIHIYRVSFSMKSLLSVLTGSTVPEHVV